MAAIVLEATMFNVVSKAVALGPDLLALQALLVPLEASRVPSVASLVSAKTSLRAVPVANFTRDIALEAQAYNAVSREALPVAPVVPAVQVAPNLDLAPLAKKA